MRTTRIVRLAMIPAFATAFALVAWTGTPVDAQGNAREQTLFVSAVDAGSAPVEGLGPADILVREDGARREVLRVSRATEPIDIALLVDNSTASDDLIPSTREGLKTFIAAMAPGNAIAIVGLADRPTIIVDYTSDQKRLTDGIGRLFTQPSSGMTFLDAIVEVSQGLAKRDTARAVIIPIITDGVEFTNRHYKDVIEAMTRAGVGFHALAVGRFSISNDEATRDREYVLDIGARDTGGQRVSLLSATAVRQALQKLARELSSQYKVVYSRPETLIPPSKIEVSSVRAGITMRATPARGQKTGG
ncbi:MAG: vWA domain-containing protein [Vicinamibacterales bacterium]